ncbi:hypothetical protein N7475_001355 [Penicillium sp. IBT 31633x]|nr:hypothetical protein N7475_001355 [Penicillium sp. IBT 31633x]
MSTRSIRKPRRQAPEDAIPDVAMQHAAVAASRAMRSNQSSSRESRSSYDRLGGPGSFAVPRRRPGSSLRSTGESTSVGQEDLPACSMSRHLKDVTDSSAQAHGSDDPAALPPIQELTGLDGRDSSVPSSYRRLRKAKSMFTTRQRTSQTPYGVPALPCGDPLDPERSPGFQLPRTMRHSMSFLRGSYQSTQDDPSARRHDAAIQLARSQFTQDPAGTGIRARRSSFLLKRKKEHRPFRKTFRATSEGGFDTSPEQRTGRSHISRSFSNSIKNGFRRVFGFSKVIPPQPPLLGVSNVPAPTMVTPRRKALGEYPSHKDTAIGDGVGINYFRTMSHSPSRDSLRSSKSRVTSWADSTTANTVTTRKPGHRQSLSLIKEDGDIYQKMPRTPAMDNTENQVPVNMQSSPRQVEVVNSRDLYSALMRQMGRNSLPDPDEDIIFGTVSQHYAVPEQASSSSSQCGKRTIRHIPSQESSVSPRSYATARCGDYSSPQKHHPRSARPMQGSRGMAAHAANQTGATYAEKTSPRTAYTIGEYSDEDSGSVIIARLQDSKRNVVSPSVYSRTTSGNTPTRTDNAEMDMHDEPGTAIIFTPQRKTYSSPKRKTLSQSSNARVNPSADWQKWMSSQIERIEQTSPTREHIREDAQFQDDDEYLTNIARQTPVTAPAPGAAELLNVPDSQAITKLKTPIENRVPSQSNFSRPFTRTSSMQTILPLQRSDPASVTQNYANSFFVEPATNSGENASPKSIAITHSQGLSPIRLRSGNMQPPESPTPKRIGAKRSWTQEQQRRYSARRAPIAQESRVSQFRSMRTQRDNRPNNENTKQQDEFNGMMDSYHQIQDIHSTISSKRMVDLFLDSRRRRMGASTDSKTVPEAFL